MGSGIWTTTSFADYTVKTKAVNLSASGTYDGLDNRQIFKSYGIAPELDPKGVTRECLDTEEHPHTKPVIIGIDVTGSMGQAGVEVARHLNRILTDLYKEFTDIEICVMGIGDLYCDHAPIQISQFESDIRIAEQLDKIFFEFGGGGNNYESYSAAWYMALNHTKLDCWKRGEKCTVITIGDEMLNPYLPGKRLGEVTGDQQLEDVNTDALYEMTRDKLDVYHIDVAHDGMWLKRLAQKRESFEAVIGDHYYQSEMKDIADTIVRIIKRSLGEKTTSSEIAW